MKAAVSALQQILGLHPAVEDVRRLVGKAARSPARTILIYGETGTGKGLVARAIHELSARGAGPLIDINCAAIPGELVESELFGHERGAFTGATDRRIGRFELAHGGTLFLDEVGDLGLEAQAKLLRAIEAREIERVGGTRPIPIDVRIIAATNKDLDRAVAEGHFREDLFFRLNVMPLHLPPLRERSEDIPALVRFHGERYRQRTGRPAPRVLPDAIAVLAAHPWPGNVRELANIVERLAIVHGGSDVRAADVGAVLTGGGPPRGLTPPMGHAALPDLPLSEALDAYERRLITQALAQAAGNVAEAARMLRTDRPNLYRRMRRLGLFTTDGE